MDRRFRLALEVPLLVTVFLFTLLRPQAFLIDPGTGMHLTTGRWILEHHALPASDLFSFTAVSHPWVPYEWLWAVFAALVEQAGGMVGLVTVCALIHALTVLHVHRRMLAAGADAVTSLLLAVVALGVLESHAHARPHLFTYLFFSILLGRLEAYERKPDSTRALLSLIPLMAVWCNFHAGYLAGILVVFLHAVSAVPGALKPGALVSRQRLRTYTLLCVALAVASCLNPQGWHLTLHIVRMLQMKALSFWDENSSPNFNEHSSLLMMLELIILGLIAWPATGPRRLPGRDRLVLVVFIYFALHAVRHVILLLLVALPPVAVALSAWLARCFPRFGARSACITTEQAATAGRRWQIAITLIAFVAAMQVSSVLGPRTLIGHHLSPGAAEHVRTHVTDFSRPYNDCLAGGTLIHEFWPGMKVFFDDRAEVYGDRFILETYLPLSAGQPGWREHLTRHRVNSAILPSHSPLVSLLEREPGWESVYRDSTNHLFRLTAPIP